jgi:pimeloyl-ACP methyl ester carboxylesterase
MVDQTVFLLPGLLCDASVWDHQKTHLADIAQVAIGDFYGFDSLTEMAQSILARAPNKFAVAGHSMGGRVALEIIRLAPERVTKLALLNTGTHPRRPGEAEKRGELIDIARNQGMRALAEAWLLPMVHPARLPETEFMAKLIDMVCRATPDIFAGQVKALLNRPEADAGLSAIKCPTFVATGRQDSWSPVAQHEHIVQHIPHATLTIFEDCGHMSICEKPEIVTQSLRHWLAH